MPPTQRDLASHELWQRSLERSRHRRELAPIVRKTAGRRKRLSLAVSAAVAAAPTAPSLASVGGAPSGAGAAPHALSLVDRHTDPILLHLGTTSPAVAQVQKKLHILVDGIYGRQTEGAVRGYQKQHGLPATGSVDVKTWLTLFPNDTVIATPAGWSATTGPSVEQASYVSSAGAPAAAQTPAASTQGAPAAHAASDASAGTAAVHAASFQGDPGAGQPSTPAATGTPAGPVGTGTGTGDPAPAQGTGGVPGVSSAPTPPSDANTVTGGPTPQVTVQPQGSAAALINRMIAAANRITAHHFAYSWGGGHNPSFSGPYDCSGAVSAVLHAAGLLRAPMVSGDFVHWGAPGPGAVTIYANATHVYMSILGHFFGTSESNPGGGAAWFHGAPRPGFAVVHVPFERMHLRPAAGAHAARTNSRLRVRRASHVHAAAASSQSNGGASAPSDQPTYDQAPPPSAAPSGGSSHAPASQQSGSSDQAAPTSSGGLASADTAPATSSASSATVSEGPAPAPDPAPAPALQYSGPARQSDASASISEAPAASTAVHSADVQSPAGGANAPGESHTAVQSDGGSAAGGDTISKSSGESGSVAGSGGGGGQSHASMSDGGGSGGGKTALK